MSRIVFKPYRASTVEEVTSVQKGEIFLDPTEGKVGFKDTSGNVYKGMVDYTDRPEIRPSLLLDFTKSDLIDPRITFSRNSTATYFDRNGVLKTAPANTPRIDFDPATGECKGLLIEEQRTNLLLYSEQFDNVAWLKTRASITANSTTAPDGALTADKLVEDNQTGGHLLSSGSGLLDNTEYTISVFAKAAERNYIYLAFVTKGGGIRGRIFNLSDGSSTQPTAVGHSTPPNGYSSKPVGNGWYLCTITHNSGSGANTGHFRAHVAAGPNTFEYTGDGTSGIYIWGAQLEAGAFPTSYIPNTTAQVPRAADGAIMTGANFSSWYRQGEGTIFALYSRMSDKAGGNQIPLMASDGTGNNIISISDAANGSSDRVLVNVGGVSQVNTGSFDYIANQTLKRAIAYKVDDVATAINGGYLATDSAALVPTVNQLSIGYAPYFSSSRVNGHIRRIAYYPKRLSNTNLQALTA